MEMPRHGTNDKMPNAYQAIINQPALFDDGSAITIDALLSRAKNLVPMPAVVIKLLNVIDDQDITGTRITKIIERDQAITAAVLRLANSAFYRPLSTITGLQTAVSWVGIRGVRDIAMAASMIKSPIESRALVDILRKHMLATGSCARCIGGRVPRINEEIAFLSGLLKDIGRFLITLAVPEKYLALCEAADQVGISASQAEQDWLGFTQAEVGTLLAEEWKFPALVIDVIRHQNDTVESRTRLAPEKGWYVATAVLADDIAVRIRHSIPIEPAFLDSHASQNALRISSDVNAQLATECVESFAEMQSVFDL
jgi:HD-like signal output (HDOD) protein